MWHHTPKRRKEILPLTFLFLISKKSKIYCIKELFPVALALTIGFPCYASIQILRFFLKKAVNWKWLVKSRSNPTGRTIFWDQWKKILHNKSQAACKIKLVWRKMALLFKPFRGTCQREWKSVLRHSLPSEDYDLQGLQM